LTFVDTSALLAMLDESDERHTEVDRTWNELLDSDEALITTSYVVVEVIALAQRRLGIAAVKTLDADVLPAIRIVWMNSDLQSRGDIGRSGGIASQSQPRRLRQLRGHETPRNSNRVCSR